MECFRGWLVMGYDKGYCFLGFPMWCKGCSGGVMVIDCEMGRWGDDEGCKKTG